MTEGPTFLELIDVEKRYDSAGRAEGPIVLKGVSLCVQAGPEKNCSHWRGEYNPWRSRSGARE